MVSPRTLVGAAGYAALAAIDSALAGKKSTAARRARYVTKPLLMPVLAAAFSDSTQGRTDTLRRSTLAAQALSWGGDVALLGRSESTFLAGVGSFFGAHVAYITGFASRRSRKARRVTSAPGVKAATAAWTATAPLLALAASRRSPGLGKPVLGYATALATMFGTSTLLDPSLDPVARRTLQAGTALFLVSDTLLGLQKFVLTDEVAALESAVMATYTAGQGLIASGVARS